MKTPTELKFDKIIKEGFSDLLKPLGFKKKGNNFYLPRQDFGQIINVQKSSRYSKDHIQFTINTGLFVPEYWLAYYTFHKNTLPAFPTEPECLIRKRIGELRNQKDTWYDLGDKTAEGELITVMHENINKFILPYFDKVKTKENLLDFIENEASVSTPLGKLIIYGELKDFVKAKVEYDKLMANESIHPDARQTIKVYGEKYGLE